MEVHLEIYLIDQTNFFTVFNLHFIFLLIQNLYKLFSLNDLEHIIEPFIGSLPGFESKV